MDKISFQAMLMGMKNGQPWVEDIMESYDPADLLYGIKVHWGWSSHPRPAVQIELRIITENFEGGATSDKVNLAWVDGTVMVKLPEGNREFVEWCKAQMPYTGPGTYQVELVHTRVHKMTVPVEAASYEEAKRIAEEQCTYAKTAAGWRLTEDEVRVYEVTPPKK